MTTASDRLAEQIFTDLRRRIIRGEIAPGARLPAERQLAATYRATRNTVREAIRKLEQARLVGVRHGQGVTVADFRRNATIEILEPYLDACRDPDERAEVLRELLATRGEVLALAVDLAVQRAEPPDVERLAVLASRMVEAAQRRDAIALAHETHAWIDALVDAARSMPVRWLANVFLDLHLGLIRRFPSLCVLEPSVERYVAEFFDALRTRDASRARGLTRAYFARVDLLLLQRAGLEHPFTSLSR
jgi:GntR family transcriptional repressor for pyruvate dehydrogenase complex